LIAEDLIPAVLNGPEMQYSEQ